MIVLRTPKGWTGPKEVDGKKTEGSWRSHQVPMAEMASQPEHVALLHQWMSGYRPDELFDQNGKLLPELRELAPKGERRMIEIKRVPKATGTPTVACSSRISACPISGTTRSTSRSRARPSPRRLVCWATSSATR